MKVTPDALRNFLATSSITDFLERHEEAGTPNEFVITGLGDCKITLGELRTLVRLAKKDRDGPEDKAA